MSGLRSSTTQRGVAEPLWVMAVHLPHFLDTDVDIGTVLLRARTSQCDFGRSIRHATCDMRHVTCDMRRATCDMRHARSDMRRATCDVRHVTCDRSDLQVAASALRSAGVNATAALLVLGDFNEFEWEDNPCWTPYYPADCRAQAKKRMAALWDTLLQGAATDVVTKHAITCCTKWSVGDRFTTNYTEWSFEYDHIFATSKLVASGAHLIPYTYPGTAKRCVDAACTGEDPPANVTALHQGSWHRGWVVDFSWVGLE